MGNPHLDSQEEFVNKSNLVDATGLQNYYDALNELEKQNVNLNSFEQPVSEFNRWPTLFEILNKKTESPLDLWSFYVFMRDEENAIDYLDFWIDTVQHINLCKAYVKGLRDTLISSSKMKQSGKANDFITNKSDTRKALTQKRTRFDPPGVINDVYSNRNSQNSSNASRSSSTLLELLMKNDLFEDQDPHRLSTFLRGETAIRTSDPLVNAKIEDLKRKSQNLSSKLDEKWDESKEDMSSNFRTSLIDPEMVEKFIENDFDDQHRS